LKERLCRLNLSWEVIALVLLIVVALGRSHLGITSPNQSLVAQIPNLEQLPTAKEIERAYNEFDMLEDKKEMAFILFHQLYQKNPELAVELGRIPEFADNDVNEMDLMGLDNFVQYYLNSTDPETESNFREILNIGKREYRKFCSPLQAVFWLAQRQRLTGENRLWKYFSLQGLLNQAWDFTEKERWDNFDIVTERLNDPRLIQYYLNMNIQYFHTPGVTQHPEETFKRKRGDCGDQATFANYCLEKAGYESYILSIGWKGGQGHSVCVYKEASKLYVIADVGGRKGLHGPYESNKEIALAVAPIKSFSSVTRLSTFHWYEVP